jgi:hypothetical protein
MLLVYQFSDRMVRLLLRELNAFRYSSVLCFRGVAVQTIRHISLVVTRLSGVIDDHKAS